MQEAAVYCNVMTNAGEPQLGLECWARSAAAHVAPDLRYDYASYVNPFDGKESPAVASASESYSKTRPCLQRARQRIAQAQWRSDGAVRRPAPERKAAAKKSNETCRKKKCPSWLSGGMPR